MRFERLATCMTVPLIALAACASNGADNGSVQASLKVRSAASADSGGLQIWRPGLKPNARTITFGPSRASGGSIQLDRGFEVADQAQWRSLAVSETDLGNGYVSRCTATLVGPVTMLTAAHCIDAGEAAETLPGTVAFGEDTFNFSCEMHPRYSASPPRDDGGVRNSYDYALCELTHVDDPARTVDLTVVAPDSVDAQGEMVRRRVLLTGYGCTNIQIDRYGVLSYRSGDGKLRIGDEQVSSVGLAAEDETPGVWFQTEAGPTEPTLCPGDSGGPVVVGPTVRDQRAPRRVVGVNSALGWASNQRGGWNLFSLMSPLAVDAFRNFAADFLTRRPRTSICGLSPRRAGDGCRA